MLRVKLTKRFDTGEHARDGGPQEPPPFSLDVDFTAPAGVTALFGASGSGKTTTLRAIAGLLRPDSGLVEVGGRVLYDSGRGLSLPARERGVGYVFQNLALFPHLTALGNVEFALSDLPRRERRERALALLEQLRVGHVAGRLPRHVSGGEAQRVALARALARRPSILLLDEPLSALDEATKRDIIADLSALNRDLRLPVLYVTHNREEVYTLAERALVYEAGRVAAEGAPAEVLAHGARTP